MKILLGIIIIFLVAGWFSLPDTFRSHAGALIGAASRGDIHTISSIAQSSLSSDDPSARRAELTAQLKQTLSAIGMSAGASENAEIKKAIASAQKTLTDLEALNAAPSLPQEVTRSALQAILPPQSCQPSAPQKE